MRKRICFILILFFNCDLPFEGDNKNDGLMFCVTDEPLEGYCVIHDRPFVADW